MSGGDGAGIYGASGFLGVVSIGNGESVADGGGAGVEEIRIDTPGIWWLLCSGRLGLDTERVKMVGAG